MTNTPTPEAITGTMNAKLTAGPTGFAAHCGDKHEDNPGEAEMTQHYAFAITATDTAADELGVRDIMIRPSEGTMVYTGDDLYIETGPLADEAALRDALLGAGWRVIGQVDSGTGQSIARVERI